MKHKIFAVCDLEETYAFRMAEYITDRISMPYTLHLFTKTEELQPFLDREEINILLIGESALKQIKVKPDITQTFVLYEGKLDGLQTDYKYINKYQNPEQIVSQILEQVTEFENWSDENTAQDLKMKIIGVYSPVKRCLQTTFALTMGQLLAREHKALYLNFESYSGFGRMLHRDFAADMMDMVYYFNCAKEKLSTRLPSIVQNINGLDYIPPGETNLDMQGISGDKWVELLEAIGKISNYEYLILDLTDGMNGLFELMTRCCKIYTIIKDDSFAMAKMEQYEKILRLNEMDDIAEKTVKCRFPFFEKLPSDLNLMTHGELAGYVKAIIQGDLYENQAN
ncbi:MAG: hypothetical protein NC433_15545 [Clostridiales bacterium]|nr:hypothetical protein [Clostridiales bacterium]